MATEPAPPPPTLWVAEPPARWLPQPDRVIDSSAVVAWLFQEPQAADTQAVLQASTPHAPSLLTYEFTNVVRTKRRSGASESLVAQAFMGFDSLAITFHPIDMPSVLQLALHYGLSAYDASYLWLAAELKCPLLSLDQKLVEATQRHFRAMG